MLDICKHFTFIIFNLILTIDFEVITIFMLKFQKKKMAERLSELSKIKWLGRSKGQIPKELTLDLLMVALFSHRQKKQKSQKCGLCLVY